MELKKIETPTGIHDVDWLLKGDNYGLEANGLSVVAKLLITKYNEIIEAMAKSSSENSGLHLQNVMPPLAGFKERRQKLSLSMQGVTNNTGVSKATISRIERGHKADYENVRKLNNFYVANGA
jgi:DNA-binding XRE family transcriptional regulator